MVTDFFLKLDGIDGDATDSGHSKWISVLDFSHGAAQDVAVGRASEVSGRGQFQPFRVVHLLDKATPKIQQYCMSGQVIKTAELNVCRNVAGKQEVVYKVKFEGLKISKAVIRLNDSAENSTGMAVEEVHFVSAKQTWNVTPIKPDGSKDGNVEANFDQVQNK